MSSKLRKLAKHDRLALMQHKILTSYRSTDCQQELLKRRDPTANQWMGNLSLVQRDYHREESNTKASNESSRVEVTKILCCSL